MSLAEASSKILGQQLKLTIEGNQSDKLWFFGEYIQDEITILHIEYGIMDAIICLELHNYMQENTDASIPYNQIIVGRVPWYTQDAQQKDHRWCYNNKH